MNKEVKTAVRHIKNLLKSQEYEEAVEACQALLDQDIFSPEIHTFHAFSLSHTAQCKEAEMSYLAALQLDGEFPNALMGLSEIYSSNEALFEDQECVAVFLKLIELNLYPTKLNIFLTQIIKCYWRLDQFTECCEHLKRLHSTEQDITLLRTLFKDVSDKDSTLAYQCLSKVLEDLDNPDLLEDRLYFQYTYCCHENKHGRDSSQLLTYFKELVYEFKGNYEDSQCSSSVGSSVGSTDDNSLVNWSRKLLQVQLFGLWDSMIEWNGAPHLPFNVCDLDSLSSTLHLLKKSTCYEKSITNIIFALDECRTDNAVELCRDNMRNKHSPELFFLSAAAYAYDNKHMNRLIELIEKSKQMLVTDTCYDKKQLLILVERFQCYISYTLSIPLLPDTPPAHPDIPPAHPDTPPAHPDIISDMWAVLCEREQLESVQDKVQVVAERLVVSAVIGGERSCDRCTALSLVERCHVTCVLCCDWLRDTDYR